MNKGIRYSGLAIIVLIILYLVGPSPAKPNLNPIIEDLQIDLSEIEAYVLNHEAGVDGIKRRNEARIVWAGERNKKTPYSLVYLHGFSASEQEGDPIHREFAKRYGCNLYLARLHAHGLEDALALNDLSVENYIESAKKAISIGRVIGDSVIVMCTSTGGTLALYLAAHNTDIKGLICYSPNIRVKDPSSFLLNNPWGKQIATAILGGETYTWEGNDSVHAYWNTSYPVDALVTMQDLVERTMCDETFTLVKQPVFMGYYYKNEKEQDQVVSVENALHMFDRLGTSDQLKRKVPFPEAGHHVIASRHKSGDLNGIRRETYRFAEEILGLKAEE